MASVTSLTKPIDLATGKIESINFTIQNDAENKAYFLPSDSPNFALAEAAISEFQAQEITNEELAERLVDATDLKKKVEEKFVKVSGILGDRMALGHGTITIDYDPIDPVLESHILRLLDEDGTPRDDSNWKSFAKFVEKLYSNTSDHVRSQLFGWLQYQNVHGNGFTITSDGDLLGYKGMAGTPEAPTSISHGRAIVNGVVHNGAIPNPMGAIVEMPRSSVQADPTVGCSAGLHVGTYAYASGFSRGVLGTVRFSPADVVSVPTECQAQKVRVSRYVVDKLVDGPNNDAVYYSDSDCPECGEELEENMDGGLECGECGYEAEIFYCERCGEAMDEDSGDDYCDYCLDEIEAEEDAEDDNDY